MTQCSLSRSAKQSSPLVNAYRDPCFCLQDVANRENRSSDCLDVYQPDEESQLFPRPTKARLYTSLLHNIPNRLLGGLIYSLSWTAQQTLKQLEAVCSNTKRQREIRALEQSLLTTHFSELESDFRATTSGVARLARFVPIVRTPVTLLVDAAEKANHANLSTLEKCSKVTLQALSFLPRIAFKTLGKISRVTRQILEVPKDYSRSLLHNPDILNNDIQALFDRAFSRCHDIKKKLFGQSIRFASTQEIREEDCQGDVSRLPIHTVQAIFHEALSQHIEERINRTIVSQGLLYRTCSGTGFVLGKSLLLAGRMCSFPLLHAAKPGRYDLYVLTALALKAGELFFASDKGAALVTTYIGKALPLHYLETILERSIQTIVHVPYSLLSYVKQFKETFLKTIQLYIAESNAFQKASRQTIKKLEETATILDHFCRTENWYEDLCTFESLALFNSTKEALKLLHTALPTSSDLQLIDTHIHELEKTAKESLSWAGHILSWIGYPFYAKKEHLRTIERGAWEASKKELRSAFVLMSLQEKMTKTPLLHVASKVGRAANLFSQHMTHMYLLHHLIGIASDLLLTYGSSLLKFSLLSYNINQKITHTKKSLLLSTDHLSQKALTHANTLLSSSSSNWHWTLKLLQVAVPAGITLLGGSSTTLTTKLFQIVLPHLISEVDPHLLRNIASYTGHSILYTSQKIDRLAQHTFHVIGKRLQFCFNKFCTVIDPRRREGLQELSFEEKKQLIELIEQSPSLPPHMKQQALDPERSKAFIEDLVIEEEELRRQYHDHLLICFSRLKEQEKRFLTPTLFASLSKTIQERIRHLIPQATEEKRDDILSIVSSFNALPKKQKEKIHAPTLDEWKTLDFETRHDLFALLATSSQRSSIPGKTPYDKYCWCKKCSPVQLEKLLLLYSKLNENDFASLVPSQVKRLSPFKLLHILDLIHTYRSVFFETLEAKELFPLCYTYVSLRHAFFQKAQEWALGNRKDPLFSRLLEQLALLFSSLLPREREEFLHLTYDELAGMTKEEKEQCIDGFQAHIHEWVEKGRIDSIFRYRDKTKVQPALQTLLNISTKLHDSPSGHLTEREVDSLLSLFRSTTCSFQSDVRMHFEQAIPLLTPSQRESIMKQLSDIDLLYKSGLRSLVKIKLSLGHFIKEAETAQKTLELQKDTLLPEEQVLIKQNIEKSHLAKKERLRELEQHTIMLSHLEKERNERLHLLQQDHIPLPERPVLSSQDIQEILGLFSPLTEEFQDTEWRLVHDMIRHIQETTSTIDELLARMRPLLVLNKQEVEEARKNMPIQHVGSDPFSFRATPSDEELSALYSRYVTHEVHAFILSILLKKRALYLSSFQAMLSQFPKEQLSQYTSQIQELCKEEG